MKIGIVGSRRRDEVEDLLKIKRELFTLTGSVKGSKQVIKIRKEDMEIISGGCPKGADRFAESIALRYNIPIKIFYPEWDKYGKSAGFVRNTDIARESDILIACVAEDRKGGTEDTIEKFKKLHPDGKIVLV